MNDILYWVFCGLIYGFGILTIAVFAMDFWKQGRKTLAVVFVMTSPFMLIPLIIILMNHDRITLPIFYKRLVKSATLVIAGGAALFYAVMYISETLGNQRDSKELRPKASQYVDSLKTMKIKLSTSTGTTAIDISKLRITAPTNTQAEKQVVDHGPSGAPPGDSSFVMPELERAKPKIVVVNKQDASIDQVHYRIDQSIRAHKDDEVKTIAVVSCKEVPIFQYVPFGGTGYQQVCDCTVLDRESKVLIMMKEFKGEEPPRLKKYPGSRTGSRPDGQMASFISGLL